MSNDTPYDNSYPEPLMVLFSLADEVHNDAGRILSATPEPLLLPFLKAINHLPIDVKPIRVLKEHKSYSEIVLTQTLKEGLHARMHENVEKANDINASLNTASYKAFCDEKITIPDFYKALLISAAIMSVRNNENSTTLVLMPHLTEHRDLFERGLSLDTPGWKLMQYEPLTYELTFSDLDAKYPVEISMRDLLFIRFANDVLQTDLSFTQVLEHSYGLLSTEDGIIEKQALDADEPLDEAFNVKLVTADNLGSEIDDVELFNAELAGVLESLLRKEEFLGFLIEFGKDDIQDFGVIYSYDEGAERNYFVIRFTHPFYPADECHVVFGETVFYPDMPIIVLKRPAVEIYHNFDLLVTEEDYYEKAELSLLDALHFMLSATGLPTVHFDTP